MVDAWSWELPAVPGRLPPGVLPSSAAESGRGNPCGRWRRRRGPPADAWASRPPAPAASEPTLSPNGKSPRRDDRDCVDDARPDERSVPLAVPSSSSSFPAPDEVRFELRPVTDADPVVDPASSRARRTSSSSNCISCSYAVLPKGTHSASTTGAWSYRGRCPALIPASSSSESKSTALLSALTGCTVALGGGLARWCILWIHCPVMAIVVDLFCAVRILLFSRGARSIKRARSTFFFITGLKKTHVPSGPCNGTTASYITMCWISIRAMAESSADYPPLIQSTYVSFMIECDHQCGVVGHGSLQGQSRLEVTLVGEGWLLIATRCTLPATLQ